MTTADSALLSLPQKSTTVRLRPYPVPGWLRAGFQLTGVVSERAASALGRKLFFSPPRTRPNAEAQACLDRGQSFHVMVGADLLRGYAWGEGPAVVLVHGWGGNAGQMSAFVQPLVDAGFKALAIDMPAHGESRGRRCSVLHFEQALVQAQGLFGPLRAVVTHSFGGAAATFALSRGLEVQRAVFLAPPARFNDFWARFRAGLGVSDPVWRRMTSDAEAWLGLRFDELQAERLAPAMSTPLLVIHDAGDREILLQDGETLAEKWPGAQLHRTHGLGHQRILRDAQVVARAVCFIEG